MPDSQNPYRAPETRSSLANPDVPPPKDLVTIGSFRFVPEAEAARLHLAHEGIQAFLANAQMVNTDWFLGNATGYVKLDVAGSQAVEARALLDKMQALWKARLERGERDAGETLTCLSCGAALTGDESHCNQCGWSYEDEVDEPLETEPPIAVENPSLAEDAVPTPENDPPADPLNWQLLTSLLFIFVLAAIAVAVRRHRG
jgi:hypothetical protein